MNDLGRTSRVAIPLPLMELATCLSTEMLVSIITHSKEKSNSSPALEVSYFSFQLLKSYQKFLPLALESTLENSKGDLPNS